MSQQDSLFKGKGASDPSTSASASSPTPFSAPQPSGGDLAKELKTAQRQVLNLLILLLVVSGTLSIYLLQEVRYDRANLALLARQQAQLEQAKQIITNYNQYSVPAMQKFIDQLGEYAKTHPNVLPILAKYGLVHQTPEPTGGAPAQNP